MIKIKTLILAMGCVVISHIANAGIYWLPSYVSQNNGLGYGQRLNDSDPITPSSCSTYNYVNSCGTHMTGTKVLVYQGLYCYKDCKCDTGYYKYNSSNCSSPLALAGEFCNNGTMATQCVCGSSYNLTTEPYCTLFDKCQDSSTHYRARTDSTGKVLCKSGCTYDADTNSCYEPATCEASGYASSTKDSNLYTCFKTIVDKVGVCYQCTCNSAYNLIKCPDNCTCGQCENLFKVTGAATNYTVSSDGKSCVASNCPAGYTAGVTKCSNSWEDISFSGMSGSQQCGKCVCRDANTACTDAAYPLTVKPQNASFDSCQPGCGNYTIKYKLKSCNSGYTLSADGKSCEKIMCSNGGYKDSIPSGYKCDTVNYQGLTCYTNCQEEKPITCEDGHYNSTNGGYISCEEVKKNPATYFSNGNGGGYCYEPATYESLSCYNYTPYVAIKVHGTAQDDNITKKFTTSLNEFTCTFGNQTCQEANLFDKLRFRIYDSDDNVCTFWQENIGKPGYECTYLADIAYQELITDYDEIHLDNTYNSSTHTYYTQTGGGGIYIILQFAY